MNIMEGEITGLMDRKYMMEVGPLLTILNLLEAHRRRLFLYDLYYFKIY